jgi:hypothetical protein
VFCYFRETFSSRKSFCHGFMMEKSMQNYWSSGLLALAIGGSLLTAGCATTEDVQRAQASADAAQMAADRALQVAQGAQQRADAANAAANAAQQAANNATASSREAAAAADQARRYAAAAQAARSETTVRLARGERG